MIAFPVESVKRYVPWPILALKTESQPGEIIVLIVWHAFAYAPKRPLNMVVTVKA